MTYLLDTDIVSAVAPTKSDRPAALARWLDDASSGLYLSAATAAEIQAGIAKAARLGAARKASLLRDWWDSVEHLYGARILPFDLRTAAVAGKIIDIARSAGHEPGFADVVIAATAQTHALTILTRNIRHFEPLGGPVLNPIDQLPPPLSAGKRR
ncbi:MAG TPA: type II toxin-antitoxin system VapC family toxin [Roseiarcus sp.]|nr:type II toxin-antitoxin system VapC family toxin [Roseiarcus sp.]